MADYYPVLRKTVAALPQNTGAARREIYQRARKAIVAQLKGYDPPLSPSEITAEQLKLEESIRKVEAEAARETLGAPPQPRAPAGDPPPRPAAPPPAAAAPSAVPPAQPVAPPVASRPVDPVRNTPSPPPSPPKNAQAPSAPPPPVGTPVSPPRSADPGALRSAIDDARKLGEAAEHTGQSARRALDGAASDPEKREPTMDGPAAAPPPRGETTAAASSAPVSTGLEGLSGDTRPPLADHEGRPLPQIDDMRPSRLPSLLGGLALVLLVVGVGAVGYSQRDALSDLFGASDTQTVAETDPVAPVADTPAEDDTASNKDGARLLENGETAVAPDARTVTTTRITPSSPNGETEVAETPQTAAPAEPAPTVRSVEPETAASPPASAPDTATARTEASEPEQEAPNNADAAPAQQTDAAQAPATPDTALVGQRAFLYEEGIEQGSAGQASSGRTVWSVDNETIDGRAETVLRMRIEVPDRDIVANMSLRPNRDQSLPASHLLEVRFELPEGFSGMGVAEVPGLVMKTTEEARGDALIGASVKVADGFFWVALSNIAEERDRNLQLLRERGWIDLPMLYENRKRAILTLEKGTPGQRAVEQAIAAWTTN